MIAAIALVSLRILSVFIENFSFQVLLSDLVHSLWFHDLLTSVFSLVIFIFFSSKPFCLWVFGVFSDFSLSEHLFCKFSGKY